MFDNTDWSYLFFRLTLSGLNVVRSLFVAYCVANTVAPERTRQAVVNAAWFGLEMYTVAQMSVGSFFRKKADMFNKFLPKASSAKQSSSDEGDSSIACEYSATETLTFDERPINMELLVLRKGKQLHVYSNIEHKSHVITNNDDLFKKVEYNFLSCAVYSIPQRTKLFDIDLSEGNGLGNFYSEGNVLLDRLFLKFYVQRFLPKEAESLIKQLDLEYEVQLIDGNADFHTLKPNHFVIIGSQGITCCVHHPPPEGTDIAEETNECDETVLNNKEKTI